MEQLQECYFKDVLGQCISVKKSLLSKLSSFARLLPCNAKINILKLGPSFLIVPFVVPDLNVIYK